MSRLPAPIRWISERLEAPGGLHALSGPRGVCTWALEAIAPWLADAATVYWIDAANTFDAPALAKAAQRQRLDPRAVLSKIQIARTFNAFQLTSLVIGRLPGMPAGPAVLADPLAPFYDDDLPLEDARRAFARWRDALAATARPVLALLVERRAPPGRGDFAPRLLAGARSVARASAGGR